LLLPLGCIAGLMLWFKGPRLQPTGLQPRPNFSGLVRPLATVCWVVCFLILIATLPVLFRLGYLHRTASTRFGHVLL
jgi:hypothetical protein